MMDFDDLSSDEFNYDVCEHPRKLMSRKKRAKTFSKFDHETHGFDKHNKNYKRASAKYASHLQIRSSDILN